MDANWGKRWWKAGEVQRIWPETFLKSNEMYCVAACARFRSLNYFKDSVWLLEAGGKSASALLLHSRQTLFPVFNGQQVPVPELMRRFLWSRPINAIQGLRADTEIMENALSPLGYRKTDYVDYDLMAIKKPFGHADADVQAAERASERAAGRATERASAPDGLVIRKPAHGDFPALLSMQKAYDLEEVLPPGSALDESKCRLVLRGIIERGNLLVAEMDGVLVGKINTNAASYSCLSVGGVYVRPAFRNRGIALCMITALLDSLCEKTDAFTLFVKKSNTAARSVYRRAGFATIADYRISYVQPSHTQWDRYAA
jgi:GNAT superfamily N-acetyltransferase